jgi:hypothetical protein
MKRTAAFLLASLLLLSAAGVLSGCGSAGDKPSESDTPSGIYWEDYQQFWEVLETEYLYLPYLASQKYDVEEIRERYAQKVASIDDPIAFCDLLDDVCREFRYFAHLSVIYPEYYPDFCSVYVDDPYVASLPQFQRFREVLTDPAISPIYWQTGEGSAEQGSTEAGPANRLCLSGSVSDEVYGRSMPEVEVTYYDDCKALLLVIPTFWHGVVERDRTVLTDALARYPDTEHIIFDIRSNGGGDSYWWDNLVAPLGGDADAWFYEVYYRDTPLVTPFYSAVPSIPVTQTDGLPDWVGELNMDRCVPMGYYDPSRSTWPAEPVPGSSAKRWLLVGKGVYSAAETFTIYCKYTGWATLVGMTTAGDGICLDPVIVKLDNTGILFRFSASTGENPTTGKPSAYAGTVPDYLTDRPLQECLKMIRGQ